MSFTISFIATCLLNLHKTLEKKKNNIKTIFYKVYKSTQNDPMSFKTRLKLMIKLEVRKIIEKRLTKPKKIILIFASAPFSKLGLFFTSGY